MAVEEREKLADRSARKKRKRKKKERKKKRNVEIRIRSRVKLPLAHSKFENPLFAISPLRYFPFF